MLCFPMRCYISPFAALVVSYNGALQTKEYTALVLTQWAKYMKSS